MINKSITPLKITFPYEELDTIDNLPSEIYLLDHIGGFNSDGTNDLLDRLQTYAKENHNLFSVDFCQILEDGIKNKYPLLNLKFRFDLQYRKVWQPFSHYNQHPELTFEHFLCSFNGGAHVSRKLLTAVLDRFGWFFPETCTKNFTYSADMLDGHLIDFLDENQHRICKKFFIGKGSQNFFEKIYSFGHVRFDHKKNIYNLEKKLTSSFLHIVSETLATSYYPFVTEKFLYSVVTRGLFLAYAQPGWHDHLERYYGFQKYNKIFDYRFDTIQNPVERLVKLMSMIAKFSVLSSDDWRDLYEMESDTIEHNYDHYFSKNYVKHLEQFS